VDIELVTTRSRWREIESEWNGLLERVRDPQIFYTPEWLGAVWEHFGGADRLFLLVCREAGRFIGVAPFCITMERRFGLRSRVVRFIGQPYSDFADLLLEGEGREGLQAVADVLRDHRREWDGLHLREIPSTSPTLVDFPAMMAKIVGSSGVEVAQDSDCFMVPIRTGWDTYYQATFRSKRRYAHRVAMERGGMRFRVVRDMAQESALFERCAFLALASPLAKDREGILVEPRKAAFFRQACSVLAQRGWLHVGLLERGTDLHAFVIGFEYAGKYCTYCTTFDHTLSSLSLGTMVILEVMQDCFRRGLSEFHMLRGWTPFKEKIHLGKQQNSQMRCSRSIFQRTLDRFLPR
jgi:CelD/BcsL family acetyltransferase involved in cellulose biosynthesis